MTKSRAENALTKETDSLACLAVCKFDIFVALL